MAGVQETSHIYFYAVVAADEATRTRYLNQAYTLGKEF
jgi:hypothetical protein